MGAARSTWRTRPWTHDRHGYDTRRGSPTRGASATGAHAARAPSVPATLNPVGTRAPMVRGNLHPIAADAHAVPAASVVLAEVVEVLHAQRTVALADEREVRVTEEIARGFGHGHEKVDRGAQVEAEATEDPVRTAHELAVADGPGQE